MPAPPPVPPISFHLAPSVPGSVPIQPQPTSLSQSAPPITTPHVSQVEGDVSSGWEEPTTIQPPTWDDEPSGKPAVSVAETSWPPSSESSQPALADSIQDQLAKEGRDIPPAPVAESLPASEPIPETQAPPALSTHPEVASDTTLFRGIIK